MKPTQREPEYRLEVIELAGTICADCAATLTAALLVMPGVHDVEVPYDCAYAMVMVGCSGASAAQLQRAARNAGFALPGDRSSRADEASDVKDPGVAAASASADAILARCRPPARPGLN